MSNGRHDKLPYQEFQQKGFPNFLLYMIAQLFKLCSCFDYMSLCEDINDDFITISMMPVLQLEYILR